VIIRRIIAALISLLIDTLKQNRNKEIPNTQLIVTAHNIPLQLYVLLKDTKHYNLGVQVIRIRQNYVAVSPAVV